MLFIRAAYSDIAVFAMIRRTFLSILGGAAVWPFSAYAQQPSTPVIGFLNSGSPRAFAGLIAAFQEGLRTHGYVHGRNVWIEYRWAEGHYDDLPKLAAELVQRRVSLIAATGGVVTALAAKKTTNTVPIVFVVGFDPVQLGLVESLNAPGGNATGVNIFTTELAIKRLELLKDLLLDVDTIAILVNPGSITTNIEIKDSRIAAQHFGLRLHIFEATSESDLETAFEAAASRRISAMLVSADSFFTSRRNIIVELAARHALPTMYPLRGYIEGGGLVSYGTKLAWAYHVIGVYAGRILKGAKTTDLPVQLPTSFELVLNLKTAKALGINVPPELLVRADHVVE
jgi:putative ABC transport system substrate-binding protein